VKSQPQEAAARVAQIIDNVKALEKRIVRFEIETGFVAGDELVTQAVDINGVKVLAAKLEGADAAILRETMDKLKDKLHSAAIVWRL